MILKKSINNVSKFIVSRNELFFEIGKTIYCNDEEIKNLGDKFYGEFFLNDGELVIQSYYGGFEYKGEKFEVYYNYLNENTFSYLDSIKNKIILIQNSEKVELDLINQFKQFNNLAIIQQDKQIHAYTLPAAQPLWQFSLSQLAPPYQKHHSNPEEPLEVASFIGVLGNQLWVALNHHTLIAIDVQTGELRHQLAHIPGFDYAYGPVIPEPMAMHIDHKRNKLIALAWEYYWEVDPQTGAITMHNLLDYFRGLHLRNDLPLHTVFLEEEGQMFFVCRTLDNVLHYTESQVACFDIQTQKVVWQYKFQPNEQGKIPQPNDLQGNSQKLAVLDMDKTLHVFEREKKEV